MRSCAWLVMLLSTLLVLSCERERQEETSPPQTETAPPPAQEDMRAPAESPPPPPGETSQPTGEEATGEEATGEEAAGEAYVTPQEGERRDMQNLEVVDKNISEATDQPSAIGTPGTDSGPETVVFEAKNGNVTFPHQSHAEREECSSCHEQSPPQKIELNQQSAHALCRGCHQERGAGPVSCTDCHKKE